MTLGEALALTDRLRPNDCGEDLKRRWISELEGLVCHGILAGTGEGPDTVPVYGEDTDAGVALLVPPPYDGLYALYLMMQLELRQGETTAYQNAAAVFQTAWDRYAARHNRTRGRTACPGLRF